MKRFETPVVGSKRRPSRRGAALPVVIILMGVISMVGLGLVNLGSVDAMETARTVSTSQAFWLAEAGLCHVRTIASKPPLETLDEAIGVGTGVLTGGGMNGSYSVDIVELELGLFRVTSTGTAPGGQVAAVRQLMSTTVFGTDGWETDEEAGIYFATGDILDLSVYSNDELNIYGTPLFTEPANSAASTVHYVRPGRPSSSVDTNVFTAGLTLHAPNLDFGTDHIQNVADCAGLLLVGDWQFDFLDGGKISYRERFSSSSYGPPMTNDLTAIGGSIHVDGDAYVSGTVDGEATLASTDDIFLEQDIRYESASGSNPGPNDAGFNPSAVDDALGLIAADKIEVMGDDDIDIHAAIFVTDGTAGFTTNQKFKRIGQPYLNVYGSLSQKRRGVVGTTSGRGFLKNYKHDMTLGSNPPPCWPLRNYDFSRWERTK